jgi:hypothetical protein
MKLLGLPNEILLKIFSNLNQRELLKTSLVSKKMKEVALDPALWTELKLTLAWTVNQMRGRRTRIAGWGGKSTVDGSIFRGRNLPMIVNL